MQQVVLKNYHYSLNNYHHTLLNNMEERSFHLLCGGSLKSLMNLSPCDFVFYIHQIHCYIE